MDFEVKFNQFIKSYYDCGIANETEVSTLRNTVNRLIKRGCKFVLDDFIDYVIDKCIVSNNGIPNRKYYDYVVIYTNIFLVKSIKYDGIDDALCGNYDTYIEDENNKYDSDIEDKIENQWFMNPEYHTFNYPNY